MTPQTQIFKRLSIHYRLLIAYSLTFFAVFSLAGLLINTVLRATIEENIETELKNSTQAILGMVKTAIDSSIRNHLRAIAENNRDIITDLYNKANQGLISHQEAKNRARQVLLSQSIGYSGYIYCIDHKGIIQVHPKSELVGTDLSDNEFIRFQKEQRTGYMEYDWANPGETGKRPKALYMTYFAPWDWIISVSSYRDEFRKLVRVEDFKQNILAITFGSTGYPYIMDSRGNLVIHPQLAGTNIYDSRDENGRMFIREVCEKKNGKIIYPWKNPGEPGPREKLVIFNYIEEMDWIVASSSYLDEFYTPLTRVTWSICATMLIMLVLIIPITWLISSRLAKPLQEMINVFKTGADAGFSKKLDIKWGGEMDEVARNYNRFVDTLDTTRQALETSRDELEARVEERTRELSSWVRELEQRNLEDSLLRKMNKMIQVCKTSQEVYQVMDHYFLLFFPGTAGALHIHDKEENCLTAVLCWGAPTDSPDPFNTEDCWALRQGNPYLYVSDETQPLCAHITGRPEPAESLCIPLMVGDGVLGLLQILIPGSSATRRSGEALHRLKSRKGLARMIAEHLSLALVNLRLQESLQQQSIRDPLTGLYNRRFLNESLKREAHSMKRYGYDVGILMVDVDHFKEVNDQYGHECGDQVLKALGHFLSDSIRGNDIACRYGGEEFVLILLKTGQTELIQKARDLCRSVAETLTIPWHGASLAITVSAGVSLCSPGQSIEIALNTADKALYTAKHQGRNQAVWLAMPNP